MHQLHGMCSGEKWKSTIAETLGTHQSQWFKGTIGVDSMGLLQLANVILMIDYSTQWLEAMPLCRGLS